MWKVGYRFDKCNAINESEASIVDINYTRIQFPRNRTIYSTSITSHRFSSETKTITCWSSFGRFPFRGRYMSLRGIDRIRFSFHQTAVNVALNFYPIQPPSYGKRPMAGGMAQRRQFHIFPSIIEVNDTEVSGLREYRCPYGCSDEITQGQSQFSPVMDGIY